MKNYNMRCLQILFMFTTIYCESLIGVVLAFAGGGGGFGMSKSKSSDTKKGSKKGNKKRRGGLVSEEFIQPSSKVQIGKEVEEEPKLDRFGLPILTAENFFPKLPPETVIEHIVTSQGEDNEENQTYLDAIKSSMKDYIQLNYDLFDANGIQKVNAKSQPNIKPWKIKLLHKNPPVLAIENFFTDDECNTYMDITKDKDENSNNNQSSSVMKINSATFSTLAYSKRTSTTWYCHYNQVPELLSKVKLLLNNLPLEQMEEAQIVRYRTGQEFSWHYDEIPSEQLSNGGQRIATLLVYLNTLSENGGGGTIFRDLKGVDGVGELTMRPRKGSALLFFPAKLDGTPDDRTLHKGEVVVEEKMIAQMWIHERKYNPVVPQGNSHDAAQELVKIKGIELGYNTSNHTT